MTMYVGAVYGGPEFSKSLVKRLISLASRIAEEENPDHNGALDVVFHIPGSVSKPDYKALRAGRLSKKERILQIQIAIPEEILDNAPELRKFIVKMIRESILIGGPILNKSGIDFSMSDHLKIAEKIPMALESCD